MSLIQAQVVTGEAKAAPLELERDLVERAKRDPEAFGVLYERYRPTLVDYVYRRTGDVHTAEDLVADTFLIVMRSLRGYRYRGVPFRFWLVRIATNVVNRWARRQRRRLPAWLETGGHVARKTVSAIRRQGDEGYVLRALLSLPPRYQAVLSLHHLEGLSVKETATVIGCREGTVRSRLARARDALRKKLNEWR